MHDRDSDAELAAWAEGHHGVFATSVAATCGFSPKLVEHRRATRRWIPLHQGVYRLAGAPASWRGRVLAACLAGGLRAVASHRSAAALWGLAGGRQDLVEITTPRWRRARHDGLVVHEHRGLGEADVTVVDAIPVTTPEVTLLHLGAVASPSVVELAFERALHDDLVSCGSTHDALQRLARSGRAGVTALRQVLERRSPDAAPTESEMETRLMQVLRGAGLPDPVCQHEVGDERGDLVARVDAAYPTWRVALEYDSVAHHSTELERARDADRRNRLRGHGWTVVEVRRDDLRRATPTFLVTLRALRRAAS